MGAPAPEGSEGWTPPETGAIYSPIGKPDSAVGRREPLLTGISRLMLTHLLLSSMGSWSEPDPPEDSDATDRDSPEDVVNYLMRHLDARLLLDSNSTANPVPTRPRNTNHRFNVVRPSTWPICREFDRITLVDYEHHRRPLYVQCQRVRTTIAQADNLLHCYPGEDALGSEVWASGDRTRGGASKPRLEHPDYSTTDARVATTQNPVPERAQTADQPADEWPLPPGRAARKSSGDK